MKKIIVGALSILLLLGAIVCLVVFGSYPSLSGKQSLEGLTKPASIQRDQQGIAII